MLANESVNEFLNEVASNSSAPGGGSVSALAGSLAAALTSMVCRLTIGKKKYVDVQSEMESTLERSEQLRVKLTAIIEEDTEAFKRVMAALAMPKETDEQKIERAKALQDATKSATIIPLRLLELCAEGANLAQNVAVKGNRNSLSDAGVSILLFQAAGRGASLNVRTNLSGLEDSLFRKETLEKTQLLISTIDQKTMEFLPKLLASL